MRSPTCPKVPTISAIIRQCNKLIESIEVWDDRVLIDGLEIEPKYDDNMYKCRMRFQILGLESPRDSFTLNFILKQI